MKLIDHVPFLNSRTDFFAFLTTIGMERDDEPCIYMKNKIDIDSDIQIFSTEESGGLLSFQKEGIAYASFLPYSVAIEIIEDDVDLQRKNVTDLDKAKRLIDYSIYDA